MADKVDIWVGANVYVSLADNPQIEEDGTFGDGWDLTGVLDGSAGFTQNREVSTTEASGWGTGVIDAADYGFKSTGGFTALEDNDVTRYLINPGSTAHVIVVPKPAYAFLAYETTNQHGETEILVTRKKARVFAPDVSKTQEFAGTAFEVTHFADGLGGLFDRFQRDAAGSVKTFTPIRIKGLTTAESPLDIKGESITPPVGG
ncbi:hypothetical protein [Ancrocorticia populi]|uniref:hypothetical protein n=1 Tax=Ancrocorticia populi TaxID=2175228 RepID=UPI003F98C7A4